MAEEVPVVVVKGEDGSPLRINLSDYEENPSAWELFQDEEVATAPVAPAPVTTTSTLSVSKIGRKFMVVDENGAVVGEGHTSEADAWAAIMALAQG